MQPPDGGAMQPLNHRPRKQISGDGLRKQTPDERQPHNDGTPARSADNRSDSGTSAKSGQRLGNGTSSPAPDDAAAARNGIASAPSEQAATKYREQFYSE
jgi:hypothetical protein